MKQAGIHNVYFIGIGGIGMSALARYFQHRGKSLAGYDLTPSPITDRLQAEGIPVHFEDDVNQIPNEILNQPASQTLVVYTPAIPQDHGELKHLMDCGFTIKKRAEVLGEIANEHFTIAVGGAHGKTTTSALIAHILKEAGIPFYGFLGGIATNYETNFLAPEKGKEASIMVIEADEYDRSFLQLTPSIAILTSADADHLDIYQDSESLFRAYEAFIHQLKSDGLLIHQEGIDMDIPEQAKAVYTFGPEQSKANFRYQHIQIEAHQFTFDLVEGQKHVGRFQSGIPGEHNIRNALAAIAATKSLVRDTKVLEKALQTFKGVKRRFEFVLESSEVIFIDDYAHHPSELTYTIDTVQRLYPNETITGVFQPHLYSRTQDFAEGFAEALNSLDRPILLPIYPAREAPIEGVSSQLILDSMNNPNKALVGKTDLVETLVNDPNRIFLTLGAGDIDRLVQPIKEAFETQKMAKDA